MSGLATLIKYDLVYLATPYSRYIGGIETAFAEAAAIAARMLVAGIRVFSPIVHFHPIAIHGGLNPLNTDIWYPADEALRQHCSALCVAQMEGWQHSDGVAREMRLFAKDGKPRYKLDPTTFDVVQVLSTFRT